MISDPQSAPLTVSVGAWWASTTAMGPGIRGCLWVRGCSINCPGCITQEYIPAGRPEHHVSVAEICDRINRAIVEHRIEGVTFSGGEPFEQATALAAVARHARSRRCSTVAWSGYPRAYLEGSHAPSGSREFLAELDVLIDGPFRRDLVGIGTPYRGSMNQVAHFLTDRYSAAEFLSANVEARLRPDGRVEIGGVVDYEELHALLAVFGHGTLVT